MHVLAGLGGAALILAMLVEFFVAFMLPRRVKRDPRIARGIYTALWWPWRMAAALLAAILAVGTLVLVVGDRGAAWAFGLPAAALAALASVGGVCVGCQLHARRAGRR